jgi:AcrR family transcriptional regulator
MVPMSPAASPFDVREALLAAARVELVEHGRSAISLRAVARRAGVSHAAPKHHFGDRAGLLTAIATEGFQALTRTLEQTSQSDPQRALAALGDAYIDFGLAHPALFELMFAPNELQTANADLIRAQGEAIGALSAAVGPPAVGDGASSETPPLALISWALAHGLAVLARDGALRTAAGAKNRAAADLAHTLVHLFAEYLTPTRSADI